MHSRILTVTYIFCQLREGRAAIIEELSHSALRVVGRWVLTSRGEVQNVNDFGRDPYLIDWPYNESRYPTLGKPLPTFSSQQVQRALLHIKQVFTAVFQMLLDAKVIEYNSQRSIH